MVLAKIVQKTAGRRTGGVEKPEKRCIDLREKLGRGHGEKEKK